MIFSIGAKRFKKKVLKISLASPEIFKLFKIFSIKLDIFQIFTVSYALSIYSILFNCFESFLKRLCVIIEETHLEPSHGY